MNSTLIDLLFFVFTILTSSIVYSNSQLVPVMIMRMKRSPFGSLTYSGFNPNGGITAFSSSADLFPNYYRRYNPQQYYDYPEPQQGSHISPSSGIPSDIPSKEFAPPPLPQEYNFDGKSTPSPNVFQNIMPPSNTDETVRPTPEVKKPKKRPTYPVDDEDDEGDRTSSSAKASFNAWFPIMLSMFPSGPAGGTGGAIGEEGKAVSSSAKDKFYGTTIISNSVSHGKNGVASSHAVAYQTPDGVQTSSKKQSPLISTY